jgi:hypothetical protein
MFPVFISSADMTFDVEIWQNGALFLVINVFGGGKPLHHFGERIGVKMEVGRKNIRILFLVDCSCMW